MIVFIQFHWNNPLKRSDYVDGSGLMIHYTPNKRIADAGVLVIGQNFFEIPPQQEEVHVTGRCNNLALNGPINITRAINHMHYLGMLLTLPFISSLPKKPRRFRRCLSTKSNAPVSYIGNPLLRKRQFVFHIYDVLDYYNRLLFAHTF